MLLTRVLTALVLFAVFVAALAFSPFAFALVAGIALALALAEWLRLTGWPMRPAFVGAVLFALILIVGALVRPNAFYAAATPLAALATLLWIVIAFLLVRPGAMSIRWPRPLAPGLAFVLVAAAWTALIRLAHQGAAMVLSVLFIVWIADTAAYFAGRALGRTKLAPHISPGKTWAGAYGGLVAVLAAAAAFWLTLPRLDIYSNGLIERLGLAPALALLALLVVLSIAGDLFESLLKRQAGVKDSGQLLPGHGGVFDRVDALMPVLPAALLIQSLAASA